MMYREQLRDGRLVALPLDSAAAQDCGGAAFQLRVRTAPSGPELDLADSWRWVRAQALSAGHHAVDLEHQSAPVNATGGVASGDWFAMEFAAADRSRARALIVRLAPKPSGAYVFQPKSLDPRRGYRMTRDNTGRAETFHSGASVSIGIDQESELLLFEQR
jgi:hypothetical protein